MKKILLIVCMTGIILSIFTACQSSNPKNPDHSKQEESDMTDFFSPTPSKKDLLTEKEFTDLIKESCYFLPYEKDLNVIALKDLIKIVGKPQREIPITLNGISGEINPRIKCFQWDLKNNKCIDYWVYLSSECSDEKADFDNIIEYGMVLNVLKTSTPNTIVDLSSSTIPYTTVD